MNTEKNGIAHGWLYKIGCQRSIKMLWKTVGDTMMEEFCEWCGKTKAEQNPRMMIEFLGAMGYLKIKKAAKKYVAEGKYPSTEMGAYFMPMKEGMIPPASCAIYEKRRKGS